MTAGTSTSWRRLARILCLGWMLAAWIRGADVGPEVVPLWPEGVPGLQPGAGPEREDQGRYSNIHHPSLLVHRPAAGRGHGTAVLYAAGGGYVRVAAGRGGGEITRWLNGLGVTVFILKYRAAEYGHPAPLRDALRAVRLVRTRAAEWGVRPDRIGMLGGSAGAHRTRRRWRSSRWWPIGSRSHRTKFRNWESHNVAGLCGNSYGANCWQSNGMREMPAGCCIARPSGSWPSLASEASRTCRGRSW